MLVISAHWFSILRLLKLLISLKRFWAEMMGSSRYTIMLSANRETLTSSFPNWIPFISFPCLIALVKTSNTILNKSGERWHPWTWQNFCDNIMTCYLQKWFIMQTYNYTINTNILGFTLITNLHWQKYFEELSVEYPEECYHIACLWFVTWEIWGHYTR